MGERSQCILNYPLKAENPANILYTYKRDFPDEDLNDKVVMSKKLFKFEDNFMTKEEQKIKKFNELALAQDIGFQDYLEKIDPIDKDFNYFKIQKLSHEFVHEYIQYQTMKFQNTAEVLKVFTKKNENINFFLSDFEGIVENNEVDMQKEDKRKQHMNSSKNDNNNKSYNNSNNNEQQNEDRVQQIVFAKVNTHSQGKCFFYVEKNMTYEFVKEYPDNHYIEIRNRENPEQIGIFKKKDFNGPLAINQEKDGRSQQLQTSNNSSNILNVHDESKLKETQYIDIDDHSEISNRSKKFSISIPQNGRKRSYSSKKNNFSNIITTPMKTSQNLRSSAQMSTTASRRY